MRWLILLALGCNLRLFGLCDLLLLTLVGVAILFEKVFNPVLENGKVFLPEAHLANELIRHEFWRVLLQVKVKGHLVVFDLQLYLDFLGPVLLRNRGHDLLLNLWRLLAQ